MKRLQNLPTISFASIALTFLLLVGSNVVTCQEFSDDPDCITGRRECVEKVITEMTTRYEALKSDCDHDTMFALIYLVTTEGILNSAESLGYDDVPLLYTQDAVFAEYYFRSYDAYHSGSGYVPPAWRLAFGKAENRAMQSFGNIFLGLIAHIVNDLPQVLFDLYKRGTPVSKADHFLVNDALAQVQLDDEEIRQTLDPNFPEAGGLLEALSTTTLESLRAGAWANYRFLVLVDRIFFFGDLLVAWKISVIETEAVNLATFFAALLSANDSSERDEFCEEQQQQ